MPRKRLHINAVALFFFVVEVSATTHVVRVRDNSFSPNTIVIEAGDTVRWINEGPGAHNVYSVGNFRCANGCEANGGSGDPSNAAWVAEVVFRNPGTFPYECQPHVQFGMVGTVVVQPPSSGVTHQVETGLENEFTPNELTITAGDVVYFSNQGGVHNIETADGSLTCAEGCEGDGQIVNTDPTGFQWEFYVRFDEAGSVPFYCANPAHKEQTGLINVISDLLFINGFE